MTRRQQTTGDRVRLTRQRIVEAALQLIDREGLEALTMRRLGRELGVEAMSLYFYFAKKDEILDHVLDLLYTEIQLPPTEGRHWEEVAHELYSRVRRVLLSHPNTVPLFATRSARSVGALGPTELSLRILRSAGFDPQETIDGHRLLMSFTTGYLLGEVSLLNDPTVDPNSWGTAAYAYRDLPPKELPHLAELAPLALQRKAAEQFDSCLTLILDGLKARLDTASRRSPRGGDVERQRPSTAHASHQELDRQASKPTVVRPELRPRPPPQNRTTALSRMRLGS